jgi:hypothetical protein
MSKQFETLFKDLASGMSRRTALRRFFGGFAGVAAVALTGRRVRADAPSVCASWCSIGVTGTSLWQPASTLHSYCPEGYCATIIKRFGGAT